MAHTHTILTICFLLFVIGVTNATTRTGDYVLKYSNFSQLANHRVGLITDPVAMVDGQHIIDWMFYTPASNMTLTTLFGPEHGLRGNSDTRVPVNDSTDARTGLPVYSLYGNIEVPTVKMLENVTALVYDLQDVGVRWYTYLSTLGYSMQSAAKKNIPFFVLDRPNPLGGDFKRASGWLMTKQYESFIGLYPIPIQHGVTVAELARMIKGEKWIPGLESLDLRIIPLQNYTRSMIYQDTGLPWFLPSPGIVDVETAFAYCGTGLFEAFVNATEGTGTLQPFKWLGAPWINSDVLVAKLNSYKLPGVLWHPISFTPRSIPGMSSNPKFLNKNVNGVRLEITDYKTFLPVETGIYSFSTFYYLAPQELRPTLLNLVSLELHSGSAKFLNYLTQGVQPQQIVASWQVELKEYLTLRDKYLIYK